MSMRLRLGTIVCRTAIALSHHRLTNALAYRLYGLAIKLGVY